MKDIIIDCDPGIDDALALILAIKSKVLNVKAITTVMGNSTIKNTTNNTLKLLDLLNIKNIPVYSGARHSLKGEFFGSEDVHGKNGLIGLDSIFPQQNVKTEKAPEILAKYLKNNKNEISIVALGPLTNIAKLIMNYPEVVPYIKELTIMGGAIMCPGNITPQAEFNIYCDVKAADIVFRSAVSNITLVPLDVTRKVILKPNFLNTLKKSDIINSKLGTFLQKSVSFYQDYCIKHTDLNGCPLHDPLAIGESINPYFMEKNYFELKVIEAEAILKTNIDGEIIKLTKGKIITRNEFPQLFQKSRNEIKVCLKVDSFRFLEYFVNNLF
ncbi:MAG: nucleoside hydrolase [Candidatus Lokiarchaeota archaeon]